MESAVASAAQAFIAHSGFVRGLALRHAPLPGLADDIVQQVLVEFLARAGEWNLTDDIRPLLATMTRHVSLRLWRERTREMPDVLRRLADHVRRLAEERDAPPQYDDELAALRRCLDRLPDKSRILIDQYYFGDQSAADIGTQLGTRADTVCRAISRVREKLRDCVTRSLAGGNTDV
ncbi:MAG: sigma-70 family RNA polymerase sigma factor [Planctomycetes bacterium]|nr:sigma-70 family RNA polymerase sigma factor [Planctomycetota bacterium]